MEPAPQVLRTWTKLPKNTFLKLIFNLPKVIIFHLPKKIACGDSVVRRVLMGLLLHSPEKDPQKNQTNSSDEPAVKCIFFPCTSLISILESHHAPSKLHLPSHISFFTTNVIHKICVFCSTDKHLLNQEPCFPATTKFVCAKEKKKTNSNRFYQCLTHFRGGGFVVSTKPTTDILSTLVKTSGFCTPMIMRSPSSPYSLEFSSSGILILHTRSVRRRRRRKERNPMLRHSENHHKGRSVSRTLLLRA
jgi:hypothetical protein